MILIVGATADPHVMAVAAAISRRGFDCRIWDCFGDCEHGVQGEIADGATLYVGSEAVRLPDVSAIWWRQKPKFVVPTDSADALYDYYFVSREWSHLQEYLAVLTRDIPSVNPRGASARA